MPPEITSADVQAKVIMNHCLRCDKRWEQRKDSRPEQCPRCKSPRWDEPPRTPKKPPSSAEPQKPPAAAIS
jgi:predicted Zn-ribbon and HTH transcriptional regulator